MFCLCIISVTNIDTMWKITGIPIILTIFMFSFQISQTFVTSLPLQDRYDLSVIGINQTPRNTSPDMPRYDTSDSGNEQVISVRITSSVAVGRGKEKLPYRPADHKYDHRKHTYPTTEATTLSTKTQESTSELAADLPPNLIGANIEYIKQLNAKKETKDHNGETVHPFQVMAHSEHDNENESTQTEHSTKIDEYDENIDDIATARKVPSTSDTNRFQKNKAHRGYQHSDNSAPVSDFNHNSGNNFTTDALFQSSPTFGTKNIADAYTNTANETASISNKRADKKDIRDLNAFMSTSDNYQAEDSIAESSIKSIEFAKTTATVPSSASYIHSLPTRPITEEQNNPRLTTVSFNIVHDATKSTNNNEPSTSFVHTTSQVVPNDQFYDSSKTYSQPAKIYSEPAKFYSEPAKIYSEPAKIYSEPAKVYSEPSKIYSEPAKFYSEPASLHLDKNVPNVPPSVPPNYSPWQRQAQRLASTTINTTPVSAMTNGYQTGGVPAEHQPERNYEIDEKISVLTDGRSHGVQESSTEKCKHDNCKVGYVVEGRQYKKYRVEERTSDGFIVGEYGVVRNEDGALRGVRYTADSDASPRLIHDALMKFLQLK